MQCANAQLIALVSIIMQHSGYNPHACIPMALAQLWFIMNSTVNKVAIRPIARTRTKRPLDSVFCGLRFWARRPTAE